MNLLGLEKVSTVWFIEMFLYYFLAIGFSILLIKNAVQKKWTDIKLYYYLYPILLITFLGIFPFYNFSLLGIAYRFFLGFLLFAPLLCIVFIRKLSISIQIVLIISGFIFSFYTKNTYDPQRFDPPYDFYHRLSMKITEELEMCIITDFQLIKTKKREFSAKL